MTGEIVPKNLDGDKYRMAERTIELINLNHPSLITARKVIAAQLYHKKNKADIIIKNSVEFPTLMNYFRKKFLNNEPSVKNQADGYYFVKDINKANKIGQKLKDEIKELAH